MHASNINRIYDINIKLILILYIIDYKVRDT